MAAFAKLRTIHEETARKALGEARQFQQGKQDEGYQKYQEIVENDYASSLCRNVKQWLDERSETSCNLIIRVPTAVIFTTFAAASAK